MKGQFIGVDVGGTKVSAATFADGSLDEPTVAPTEPCAEALLEQIVASVRSVATSSTTGVGIGVPSVIEWRTGRVKSSVNVPLKDIPLRSELTQRLDLPVFVDNDATVAALAEAYEGEHLVARDLVMFTVGTGVGGGLVLGGDIYRGATGAAPELGHILIGLDLRASVAAPTHFPQPGSLEALASGRALDRLGAEAALAEPDSPLGRVAAERPVLGRDVLEAAGAGDERARDLVILLGQRLGIGIANAINLFDPEQVVIGGGAASAAGELLLGPAREVAWGYVTPGVGEQTEIRLARYGAQAGVRGAAMLAAHEMQATEAAKGIEAGRR